MDVFEIVIQRRAGDGWPVVTEYKQSGEFLPLRREGILHLDEAAQEELQQTEIDPLAYGTELGQALFQDTIRDAFKEARANSPDRLRVLLVIEDAELRPLHWENLCAPIGVAGRWAHLALDQRALFSLYMPSLTDRRFPAISRRDLRALVVVAVPPEDNQYGIAHFDGPATVASVRDVLGDDIPHDILANVEGADGKPTLNEISQRITGQHYTILHIVAHGWYRQRDGETILYLLDDDLQVSPTTATRFIERLDRLQGARGLPHLTFLSTCESASPEAEREGAMGGLAQRLVRELGMPAVIAMTKKVSIETATDLACRFYERLRDHGEVDRALVEAEVELADAGDVTVPALYGRLGGRPLFSDTLDRELTDSEVENGLVRLEKLLPERAPVLETTLAEQSEILCGHLGADRAALSPEARQDWDQALDEVNAISEECLDLGFRALALGQSPPAYDDRCPFPGLAAFQPDDKEFFFGREPLVAALMERLKAHNFLALLGPSGSGKSSVVLAGMVTALRQERQDLQLAYLTPGGNPVAQLECELDQVQLEKPALVIVDQFEELFTLVEDEDLRQEFLDRLLALPEKMPVVITMRADFWGECAAYPALKNEMQKHQELIGPMDTAELRSAMEQQAAAVGLRFEADLSNTILDAVKEEPGAMPLLQHALLEMWLRRHGRWLRTSEYRKIGGVQRAIAETADKIYDQLTDTEQTHMRDIFIRLTRLGDDSAGEERRDTRHRVQYSELIPASSDPTVTRRLVQQLADARLVVTSVNDATGQEEVEVAHEALIRYWPRLQEWLDEDRELLRLRDGIRQAARDWQESPEDDRENMLIHRGSRLEEIEVYMRTGRLGLNEQEQAYVTACIEQREAAKQREEEQRQRELRLAQERAAEAEARQEAEAQRAEEAEARRETEAKRAEEQAQAAASLRKRAVLITGVGIVAGILAVAAFVLAVQATDARNDARAAQGVAEENERIAVEAQAETAKERDRAESEKERAEAEKERAEVEKERAEAQARLALSRELASQSDRQFDASNYDLALLLAVESAQADETAVASVALHQALTAPVDAAHILEHDAIVYQAEWDPDESRVLTASDDGLARVWDVANGVELLALPHDGAVNQANWNGDGSLILTASDDFTARVWDAVSGAELLDLAHEAAVIQASWNGDGSLILTASDDFTARVWDAVSGAELLNLPHETAVIQASWNGDGSRILSVGDDGTAHVWDTADGAELLNLPHETAVNQAGWSQDGGLILTAAEDGVHFWEAETGVEVIYLPADAPVTQATMNQDDSLIMTVSEDGLVLIWDSAFAEAELDAHFAQLEEAEDLALEDFEPFFWDPDLSPPRLILRHDFGVRQARWNGDETFIVTASDDGKARIWDTENGSELFALSHDDWVMDASWNRNGDRMLTASWDGTAGVWEVASGLELPALSHGGDEEGFAQASWNGDGSRVLTVGWDGTARIWDATTAKELLVLSDGASVEQASWNQTGSRILTISENGTARVWDAETGQELFVLPQEAFVTQVSWNAEESRILTVSDDGQARIWDAESGAELLTLSHDAFLSDASWSEDGSRIFTVGCDEQDEWDTCVKGSARVLDAASGAELLTLPLDEVAIQDEGNRAILNSDGSRLFTHDFGPTAHIWDLASGEGLTISHDTELTDAVWNEDGSRVLTASWDRTARVWDAASGAELLTLLHEGTINHAIWNRDESRILTVSDDRTARVWDAETGDLLTILPHSAGVDQASWDRSESRILTVSNDGRATLFYVTLDDLVDAACGRARRNMTPLQWALFMGDEPYRATCPDLKTGLAQAQPTPSEGGTTSSADDSQPTSTSTTPTPEPTSTPVPTLPLELASFEDPAGVFGLSYPANFDQVEEITDRAHGFAFVASDGSGVATVFFDTLGEPLTDTEWQAFLDGGFADFAAEIGLDEDTVDVDVQVGGPGDHYLYLEFESETADAHGLMWVEEIDGIRAAAILGAPIDLWPEMQIALAESLDSFAWSPEALYAQSLVASALEPAESAPTEQPTDEAPMPTATAAATEAATSTATPEPESTATLEATPTPAPVALTGKIVFPVYDPNKPLQGQVGGYDVWVSDPQGNDRRLLVPNASQPDLSPDGDLLAYRSWDPSQRGIISAASSGGPGDLLTSFLEDGLPSWAPDAASMAFTSRREGDRASRLYRANGGERELGVLAEYVSTFPDGRLVIKGCTLQGECGLFITGADGGPLEPISNNTSDNAPAPSPDGGQIAFMSSRDGNWEIYLMGSSGGNVTRLTENAANDGLPAWSPDGRTIAFASDRDGVWAIWAMNADGSDQRKLFDMGGSPNGVVGYDVDNSKGWFEERISWAP